MRALAFGGLIAAASFGLLLAAFAVRVSNLSSSRDEFERQLTAVEGDLQVTSDELEQANVELDDTRTALELAEDQAESLAEQLDESSRGTGDRVGATQAEIEDLVLQVEQLTAELDVAESRLTIFGVPESPESAVVTIDGTWFFTWSDEGVICENFIRVDCPSYRRASLISPTEGRVKGERVIGGRVSPDSLDFSMTTTSTGDFVCFGTPMRTTRNLTFHVVAGVLEEGTVSARAVEGQVEIIATSPECPVGRIVLPFTAKRSM